MPGVSVFGFMPGKFFIRVLDYLPIVPSACFVPCVTNETADIGDAAQKTTNPPQKAARRKQNDLGSTQIAGW